jgi:hypothetical protein
MMNGRLLWLPVARLSLITELTPVLALTYLTHDGESKWMCRDLVDQI